MEIKLKPRLFEYTTSARWTDQRKGVVSCAGKPDLSIASPPEFRGHAGHWTPEDLLVAAIDACEMLTFLALASRHDLPVLAYESQATGTLETVEGDLRFTKITVRPRIVVEREEDVERARDLFGEAESACPLASSLMTWIQVEPRIMTADPVATWEARG